MQKIDIFLLVLIKVIVFHLEMVLRLILGRLWVEASNHFFGFGARIAVSPAFKLAAFLLVRWLLVGISFWVVGHFVIAILLNLIFNRVVHFVFLELVLWNGLLLVEVGQ